MLLETPKSTASPHPEEGNKKRKKEKENGIETQIVEKKDRKEKKKKRSSETLGDGSAPPQTLELDLPDVLSSSRRDKGKEILLSSIAAFLEGSGFSKTLSVFRSEAQIVTDGLTASVLNLEDIFFKSLESRTCEETIIHCPKEQEKVDASNNGACEKILDASENTQKKKRKHRNETDDRKSTKIHKLELENSSIDCISNGETISVQTEDALQVKPKENGANKPKDVKSTGHEDNTEGKLLDPVIKNAFNKNVLSNSDLKSKDRKKKRGGETSSENLHAMNPDQLDGEKYQEGKKESKELKDVLANSDTGMDDAYVSGEHTHSRKISKKRKGFISEEGDYRKLGGEVKEKTETVEKLDKLSVDNESISIGKKREAGKSKENSTNGNAEKKDGEGVSLDSESLSTGKKRKPDKTKEISGNGNAEKEGEGDAPSTKKEKPSAESTIKAFQRVKLGDVEFADQRLQDNSYWAKGGADSGYGAKAQVVLGQVKGSSGKCQILHWREGHKDDCHPPQGNDHSDGLIDDEDFKGVSTDPSDLDNGLDIEGRPPAKLDETESIRPSSESNISSKFFSEDDSPGVKHLGSSSETTPVVKGRSSDILLQKSKDLSHQSSVSCSDQSNKTSINHKSHSISRDASSNMDNVPTIRSKVFDVTGSVSNGINDLRTYVRRVVQQFEAAPIRKHYPSGFRNDISEKRKLMLFPYDLFVNLYNFDKLELCPCGLVNCGNRDFRHEKTKKKRGSYRGGQIDFESHSIKFSNSDEE